MIYFIINERANAVKIGRAVRPEQRVRELQCGSVDELKLLATFKAFLDESINEKFLQRKFQQYHIRGEWFEFSPEIKEFIEVNSENAKRFAEYLAKQLNQIKKAA